MCQPREAHNRIVQLGFGFLYLAQPGSPGRSTARRPNKPAEEGTPRKTPAAAAGSSGTQAVEQAGGTRQPAAGTRRRRTTAQRCRTGGGGGGAAADTAAPTAGTRGQRTRSGACRPRQASRRSWCGPWGGFARVGESGFGTRERDGDS